MSSRSIQVIGLVLLHLLLPSSVDAEPIGSAFTYQGSLEQAGEPANGLFDFEFRLFVQEAGGNQTGGTVAIGVRYYQDLGKWVVRNLDLSDMVIGSHFNIMVVYP